MFWLSTLHCLKMIWNQITLLIELFLLYFVNKFAFDSLLCVFLFLFYPMCIFLWVRRQYCFVPRISFNSEKIYVVVVVCWCCCCCWLLCCVFFYLYARTGDASHRKPYALRVYWWLIWIEKSWNGWCCCV